MLSFPLPVAEFLDLLPVVSIAIDLTEGTESDADGNGVIYPVDVADRFWRGSVTVASVDPDAIEIAIGRVRVIQSARASFLLSLPHYAGSRGGKGPAAGLIAGRNGPRRVRLQIGSATVGAGDLLSFTDDFGRVQMHQLAEGGAGGADGLTGWLDIEPPLRDGAVGHAIELQAPVIAARYVPRSLKRTPPDLENGGGFTFDFFQDLRANV